MAEGNRTLDLRYHKPSEYLAWGLIWRGTWALSSSASHRVAPFDTRYGPLFDPWILAAPLGAPCSNQYMLALLAQIEGRGLNLIEGALIGLVIGGAMWMAQALKQKTPAGPESSEGDTETQDPTPRD